jgi:putative transposase
MGSGPAGPRRASSPQGSQYVSPRLGERGREARIRVSMGAKGSAPDNAAREAFFDSLKRERVNRRSWAHEARGAVRVHRVVRGLVQPARLHSTLGYLSPNN